MKTVAAVTEAVLSTAGIRAGKTFLLVRAAAFPERQLQPSSGENLKTPAPEPSQIKGQM